METFEKRIERELLMGDKRAFEKFYKTYFRELWRFAIHYVMSKEIARDIVQDSFVMLLENRKSIDPEQSLKGYLYVVVKNRCLNHLRSFKIADTNQCRLIEALIFTSSFSDEDGQELMDKVNHYREELSEQQRIIIDLKIEGKSYVEIANDLGITTSTVNVHIKRAYKFLRDRILILFFFNIV